MCSLYTTLSRRETEQSRDIEAARAYLEDFLTREVEND